MLNANEAYEIAIKVNEVDNQLELIEEGIVKQANKGRFELLLFPSVPYHPKTIQELKGYGYKVTSYFDRINHHYSYNIKWGNEEE